MAAATATSLLRLSLPPPSRPTAANRLLSKSPGRRRHHPHLGFRFHAISPPRRQETLGATPLRSNLRSRPMGKGGQDEGKRRDGSDSSGSEPATPAFPAWVRTPSECLAELGVSADRGLSAEEAAARLRRYGPNELERHAAPSVWKLVLEQFDDTLVHILLAAAVVSFVLALYDCAEGGEVGATAFVEPLVIFLILIINAVVGVWQESNAEKALEALKEIQSEHATVMAAMAAFDSAVSDLDAASAPRLAAHQYNQLLHLLAAADSSSFPSAAAARRVFSHMLEAGASPSEATITSLARVAASDATNPAGADEAFELVATMKEKYGLSPRLRSYSPVLAAFRRAGEVDKAYAVEAHMAVSAVWPEEPELAALLDVSAKAGDADKVYEYMHKLRRAVDCVSEETAEVLEGSDKKRVRRPYQTKTFKVELCFAAKIPISAIAQALRGQELENTQEAIRVIDIILRQHSAKQGCLLVRQSFFHNNPSNFVDLGGGVMGCRGFHSSFRATQSGLSLNIDVSTTMIVKPGPVIDFLLANQKVDHPNKIDWAKAKRALKNLRIKTSPANTEYKIVGLSERNCYEQMFTLKQRNGDNGDSETTEISVYDYFVKSRGMELRYSGDLPCINVGKPKRPTYFPIELCSLVPLQRYTKAMSTLQRSLLIEKSRQKPQERMSVLSDVLRRSNYDAELMLKACGISIAQSFTQVGGRVLQAPKLKVGNGEHIFTRNGRWNFNNKRLIKASSIEKWAVVNFSTRCNVRDLVRDLIKCGGMKGIKVDQPFDVFEENPSMRRAPAAKRVDGMFEQIKTKLPGAPMFLLCVLAERKL